jgi:hypothetical protein
MEALVKSIVDRCEPAVWDRAGDRAIAMSAAEARGYLRARAAAVAEVQVDRAMQIRSRSEPTFRQLLLDGVKNEIVRQLHKRILNARHPAIERRRAA